MEGNSHLQLENATNSSHLQQLIIVIGSHTAHCLTDTVGRLTMKRPTNLSLLPM